ncbi:hypothetical protein [Pantoea sp.]|uniref:hypothetical protein n=1 Tax=Pantoea sp. TaxID=69393 RepID=UPI0028A89FB2|nr:hypothetical protein [Pantoea sp.]
MSEVKHAIAIVKEKLGNAEKHNLGYQRFSIAEMEAIWCVLAKTDAVEGKLPACKTVKEIWKDRAWTAEEKLADVQQKLDALAVESAALKEVGKSCTQHWAAAENGSMVRLMDKCIPKLRDALNKTPATDAYLNSVRAEGIHFAANRMLAAWDAGFIDDTPAQVHDITGAVLSALEFLPNASPGEFKRDFADEIRSGIAAQLRAGKDGE